MRQLLTIAALAAVAVGGCGTDDVMGSREARECHRLLSVQYGWPEGRDAIIADYQRRQAEHQRREYEERAKNVGRDAGETAVKAWRETALRTAQKERDAARVEADEVRIAGLKRLGYITHPRVSREVFRDRAAWERYNGVRQQYERALEATGKKYDAVFDQKSVVYQVAREKAEAEYREKKPPAAVEPLSNDVWSIKRSVTLRQPTRSSSIR